ncbi:MAG TPA: phosphomannomutase/phosphoglucomutase [Bryobacteraceae bacterium]|nr:phosphomannomutase/phosphoglucomutase [Bryobacteraceae bacterium]
MLKPTIFREYDIRGIAETELADDDVKDLGRALGTMIQRRAGKRISLGRDCRLSSPRLHAALIEGLIDTGAEVTEIGVVPTPVLYYSGFHLKTDGSVMITASHNPKEFNGFKAVCADNAIFGGDIQELRKMIDARDFQRGRGSQASADVVTPYVEEIAGQIKLDRRLRVCADAGNGTGGVVAHRIYEKLKLDVTELFFEMDGNFPNHHPDPTVEENLRQLIATMRGGNFDMGIAYDGDADRVGATDEHGHLIFGDLLLLICGREILTRKPGATFIAEVKCSQILYDELRRLGGNAIMYKTGHSLIKAKMKEVHAELAGEMSGHMFFADRYYGFDDAIYAGFRLMEIVARSGQPMSAQLDGLPKTVSTPEIREDMPDEIKFDVVKKVTDYFRSKHADVIDIDGVRVKFAHGWGLLRASNTQPALVMRFEAETEQQLDEYRGEFKNAMAQARR